MNSTLYPLRTKKIQHPFNEFKSNHAFNTTIFLKKKKKGRTPDKEHATGYS